MKLARSERALIADEFRRLGADAPTLDEGWTAFDLAAHLYVRESDAIAAPGMFVRPLEGVTQQRMERAKRELGFEGLVRRIQDGPGRFSMFSLPGVDALANGVEYFVHHEDLRRGAGDDVEPRQLSFDHQQELWKGLGMIGRRGLQKSPVPVVAHRTDVERAEPLVLAPGADPVVLRGEPGELVLFALGRGNRARLEFEGDPAAVERLRSATFSI